MLINIAFETDLQKTGKISKELKERKGEYRGRIDEINVSEGNKAGKHWAWRRLL